MAHVKGSSKKKKSGARNQERTSLNLRLQQTSLVLCTCFGVYLLLALINYSLIDPSFPHHATLVHNLMGLFGAWCADLLFSLSGLAAYIVPLSMLYYTYIHWLELRDPREQGKVLSLLRLLGWLLILISLSGLFTLALNRGSWPYPDGPGGILGNGTPLLLVPAFNFVGSLIMLIGLFCVGLTLFSGKIWLLHFKNLVLSSSHFLVKFLCLMFSLFHFGKNDANSMNHKNIDPDPNIADLFEAAPINTDLPIEVKRAEGKKLVDQPAPAAPRPSKPAASNPSHPSISGKGAVPGIELLDEPKESSTKINKDALNQMALLVEQKLLDFGIQAKVSGVCPGPVVTRYEIQLAPGIKVARLSSLDKDLARSLSVSSVRVVEVIPGKTAVGLELPNTNREIVRLREVLDSEKFRHNPSVICMGLGKDIGGNPEVVDLGKMPHLLVAGTTGSGKSVGINAMILSMLLKSMPKDLRLIMIDPKMLELSIYEGIPHLLTPVVTDMKEAANALRWCVKEMDRRYRLMAALGVRSIAGFNEMLASATQKGQALKDPVWLQFNPGRAAECPTLEAMPYIVVIVDEFADMMMVVGKKVEELITRLAQKARAAGIHLILATQRPSVDVITGLIKANVPTRIAFQVSSRIDSRTILDQQGAEQLLGYGDMLYLPAGSGHPQRIHGAYVSDQEVHRVVEAWKAWGEPDYLDAITATDRIDGEEGAEGSGAQSGEADPLYDEAVAIVLESKRASISLVQRRLRIGYNRAARLLEDMEQAGMVSEIQANGMREILVESR